MTLHPAKPLLACLLGVAVLAGCASPQSSTSASTAAASGMQKGKIVAVEPAAAGTTMGSSSSGASATGTSMAGSPSAVVTVQFADGSQSRYSVTQQKTSFKIGDPVSVIMRGDSGVIMSP